MLLRHSTNLVSYNLLTLLNNCYNQPRLIGVL
jgi:hypothetical protein